MVNLGQYSKFWSTLYLFVYVNIFQIDIYYPILIFLVYFDLLYVIQFLLVKLWSKFDHFNFLSKSWENDSFFCTIEHWWFYSFDIDWP